MEELNKNESEVVQTGTEEVEGLDVSEGTEITEEQAAVLPEEELPEIPEVKFIGQARFDQSSITLATSLIAHTLGILGETNAKDQFQSEEDYLHYVKDRLFNLFYGIFPAGAVTDLELKYTEDKQRINTTIKMQTAVPFDIYSDRVPVTAYVKSI